MVEISDWSLHQDRLRKAPIYARAGVPEYWIVNLVEWGVEIRREPDRARARYGSLRFARAHERIETLAAPGRTIPVRDLLPEPGGAPTA